MPQYMLLIYTPAEERLSPDAAQAEMPKWGAYTQALQDAGVMSAGDALHDTDAATTVRVRDGETVVSDGPFAETKEVLGGYYVIDVPDLDEALKWAAKIPSAPRGSVEVRPVVVFDEQGRPVSQAGASA
ncbi:MAG: YciI family protein [Thermoleophilaceae bacterium]